jgi:hypothetical protein
MGALEPVLVAAGYTAGVLVDIVLALALLRGARAAAIGLVAMFSHARSRREDAMTAHPVARPQAAPRRRAA